MGQFDSYPEIDIKELIGDRKTRKLADIQQGQSERPFRMQKAVIALDTAATEGNPYVISIPFQSIFIRSGTDGDSNVDLHVDNTNAIGYDNRLNFKRNDSYVFPFMVSKSFLTWSAQAGKSVTIYFFPDGEFRTGTLNSQTAGGVSITEGSTVDSSDLDTAGTAAFVSVTTTATLILPTNTDRKVAYLNILDPMVLGDASIVATAGSERGISVGPGIFEWRLTAPLYGRVVAGTSRVNGITGV